jgi:glycosyltransferase involved in cell wall biosynthesis
MPVWSVAVFAHNIGGRVTRCLDSIVRQRCPGEIRIHVLANGCTDATRSRVREFAADRHDIELVTLALADKANAWNHYVHEIRHESAVHFFVDGDTMVGDDAFQNLNRAIEHNADANAVGALPMSGRNRAKWSQRMRHYGRLAGGLYALRGSFVTGLRKRSIRLPIGLIGDDLFISCLAKESLTRQGFISPDPRLVFAQSAGFAFDSLTWLRPHDWLCYARRLVRYRVRDYQITMLLRWLEKNPTSRLPTDVATIYRNAPDLPDYYWRGWLTPVDMLAVRQIRRVARRPERST